MAKIEQFFDRDGFFKFICPGCKCDHFVNTNPKWGAAWDFNGSVDKPTFSPSVLVGAQGTVPRCHSFVTDGAIRFLSDCDHELANQTVEIPDYNG